MDVAQLERRLGRRWDLRSVARPPRLLDLGRRRRAADLPRAGPLRRGGRRPLDHAIRVTFESTRNAWVHPASHCAGDTSNPNAPAMGTRLRLKAGYGLGGFSGGAKAIAEALKHYGMIVADNGSNWYFSGSSDRRWDDENLNQLKRIPGSAFQVVKRGPPSHLLSAQPASRTTWWNSARSRDPVPRRPPRRHRRRVVAADQHHLGRRVALQLVLDRLHDVLVADPGLGRRPGLGQRRDGRDQVALGAPDARPRRRTPSDRESRSAPAPAPAPRRRLRARDRPRPDPAHVARLLDRTGGDEQHVRPAVLRRSSRSARAGAERAAMTSRARTAAAPTATPSAGPAVRNPARIGRVIAQTISGSFRLPSAAPVPLRPGRHRAVTPPRRARREPLVGARARVRDLEVVGADHGHRRALASRDRARLPGNDRELGATDQVEVESGEPVPGGTPLIDGSGGPLPHPRPSPPAPVAACTRRPPARSRTRRRGSPSGRRPAR